MVGGTRPDTTTCNRQQFLSMARSLSGFERLAADIGSANAGSIAELIFEAQVRETNPADRYILIAADQRPQYPARIDRLLQAECTQIGEKRAHAAALLKATKAGRLRGWLAEMTEPEASYTQTRDSARSATPEREIVKARDWIARSMHGDAKQTVLDVLTRHVLTAPAGAALGPTPRLLDQVHAEVVTDAPRVRSPNILTAYPSSIGGRFLLELIFQWTSSAVWPAPGDEQWLDVALFYLGAVATVQGYPDGNKRAARMGYAITLLKGKRRFVAPSPGLESELVRMRRIDDE